MLNLVVMNVGIQAELGDVLECCLKQQSIKKIQNERMANSRQNLYVCANVIRKGRLNDTIHKIFEEVKRGDHPNEE